ncbi:UPF0489 family protein [Alkalihalobacillus sp. FSL W8-0930]
MRNVLDIDMDFFLKEIPYSIPAGEKRVDDEYYPPWEEKDFRNFLEENCLLSKEKPTRGKIIKHHDEAFHLFKEKIELGQLAKPFRLTHIDGHSDLGLGDSGWVYISQDLTKYPIAERINNLKLSEVKYSNYVAYLLALGWVSEVDFITPPDFNFEDFFVLYAKDLNEHTGFFEFKHYGKEYSSMEIIDRAEALLPTTKDPLIPFKYTEGDDYCAEDKPDFVVFCQSPNYTPKTADYMLDVIKEYIIIE